MKSELGDIIRANKKLFSEENDGDRRMIVLFIAYELLKNEQSFWHPYF